MAVSELHTALTLLGAKWLKKNGFGVVATELACFGSREKPDVLGFRSACSALIEAKISRRDFLADKKKPERETGGLGVYRFYLCPPGVIVEADLPPKWGLLYAVGRNVQEIVKPRGNLWPALSSKPLDLMALDDWLYFQHTPNESAERSALYSIARRLSASA